MSLLKYNTVVELRAIAREHKLRGYSKLRKAELVAFIQEHLPEYGNGKEKSDSDSDSGDNGDDSGDEHKHDDDYKYIILDAFQDESKELFKDGESQRARGLLRVRKIIKEQVPHVYSIQDLEGVRGIGKGTIDRVKAIIARGTPRKLVKKKVSPKRSRKKSRESTSRKSSSRKKTSKPKKKPSRKKTSSRKKKSRNKASRSSSKSKGKAKAKSRSKRGSSGTVTGARAKAVKKSDVMLAHDLAKKPETFNVDGWWASHKWDGVRFLTDAEGRFYTRSGKRVDNVPAWLRDAVPKGHLFDGEFESEDGFVAMNSIWRSSAKDERWNTVRYRVFDLRDDPDLEVEERWKRLEKIVNEADNDSFVYVPQKRVKNRADAFRMMRETVKKGGEGIVLRKPGSRYEEGKRSHSMLKVKPLYDDEAKVIGHAKDKDSLMMQWLKNGVTFNLSTNGKSVKNYPIGTIITVEFMTLNPSGRPRQPVLLRVRAPE